MTTWYLEQTDHAELRAAKPPAVPVELVRAEIPGPEFNRFLYTAVGGDLHWTDRLSWSWQQWWDWLERPGVETWVAWVWGTPAGYAELEPQPGGQVEVAYFGLLPAFTGQRLGGHLLWHALDQAWTLGERTEALESTRRVWVHTCSLDSPAALQNYQARGMRVYDTVPAELPVPAAPPGPWPGADR